LRFLELNTVGRPIGAKNKRTLLREAEEAVDRAKATNDVPLDCIFVIERAMRHFYLRAETGKAVGRSQQQVDEDYKQAAALATLAAPYRHARLSAVKLAGDANNPLRVWDGATAGQLRAEILRRLGELTEAGLIDLTALPAPKRTN
jgi:hypothetical protein